MSSSSVISRKVRGAATLIIATPRSGLPQPLSSSAVVALTLAAGGASASVAI